MKLVICCTALVVALVAGGIQTYRLATVTSFNADESGDPTLRDRVVTIEMRRGAAIERIEQQTKEMAQMMEQVKAGTFVAPGPRVMTIDY